MGARLIIGDGKMVKRENKSMTYNLGYSAGRAPPSSINYEKRLHVPIRSFSNPRMQKPLYIAGWNAGRQALRRWLKKK